MRVPGIGEGKHKGPVAETSLACSGGLSEGVALDEKLIVIAAVTFLQCEGKCFVNDKA